MIEVTCAIIRNDESQVLIVQRPGGSDHPGKWEFPGGKVNEGETLEECIIREVEEELSMEIVICNTLKPVEHDYGFKKIRLIPFICDTLLDLPVLKEHSDYRWIRPDELGGIDFAEADIPVAGQYTALVNSEKVKGNSAPARVSSLPDDLASGIIEMLSARAGFESVHLLAESAAGEESYTRALLGFSVSDDEKLAFRASYVLVKVAEKDHRLLHPWVNDMVLLLPGLESESVIRSFLKILTLTGVELLGEEQRGILADRCFEWLDNGSTAIAIKAYSMELLYYLAKIYPSLVTELSASINRNMEGGSAGIIARGRQILTKILKDNLQSGGD